MGPDVEGNGSERPPARANERSRWPTWAAGTALVVAGLAAGGAIVTVTGISADTQVEVVASPSPSPSPVGASGGTPLGNAGSVEVAPACIHALDQAQTVYDQLKQLGNAASSLDVDTLDKVVRQLQDMEPTLRENLGACHATVHLPTTTPTPTASS
jgi:hypothetical protein